jgi:hypothetical protein
MSGEQKNYSVTQDGGESSSWTVVCDGSPIIGVFRSNEEAWSYVDRQHRDPLWRCGRYRFRAPANGDDQ